MGDRFIILYVLMGVHLCIFAHGGQPGRFRRLVVPDLGEFPDFTEEKTATTQGPLISSEPSRPSSNCGGYVELTGTNEIFYQIPQGFQRVSCIWVVWAKNGHPALVHNVYNEKAQFGDDFQLFVLNYYESSSGFNYSPIALGSERNIISKEAFRNFFVLFFGGNPTKEQQGVHIKMSNGVSNYTNGYRPKVKFIQFDRRSGVFRYPPPGSLNNSFNERVFMIGRVPEGKSIDIWYKMDVERLNDAFLLACLYGSRFEKTFVWTDEPGDSVVIPGGTAYLMAFITDKSRYYNYNNIYNGVDINYKYNDNYAWV